MSLTEFFTAVELGAASVYHRALAIVPEVIEWTEGHPELAPLIKEGAAFASGLLPEAAAPAMVPLGSAVLASLKLLAARDATVPSGG